LDRVFDSSTTGEDSLDEEPSRPSVDDAKDLGKTVAGKYVLRRLIGKGGMGAVFEAEHVELGKRVAIKILRAIHASRGREAASRFRREARAASSVDSEHIVDVFDVGEDADLGLFMVMELLDGEDLGALLCRVGHLEPTLALAIARQAAVALDKAHAAGVVHRDLKPENVFLRARDTSVTVKLVDFGVAKLLRDVREQAASGGVTRAGSVLGTPSYMSPEQAMGLPEVDHRTDLYSLGALLYEMLVGEPAFPHKATYEMTIVSIVTGEAPRVADKATVLPELDRLVTQLMSREPDARPSTAAEVVALIDELEPRAAARRLSRPALDRGSFSDEPPAPPSSRGSVPAITSIHVPPLDDLPRSLGAPPPKAEPPRTIAIFALVLAVLGVGSWLALRGGPPPAPKPTPPTSATAITTTAPPQTSAPPPASASAAPPASAPVVTPGPSASSPASASATAPRPKLPLAAPKASAQVGGAGITNEF
jgi:serine/threonine-protein kinase